MIVADLSGGKDSIAMGLRLLELGEHVDAFIFADTGFDFPEAIEAIDKFEALSGREIIRLKPERSFIDVAAHIDNGGNFERERGYGWPSWRRRWCNHELKRRSIKRFDREHGMPTHLIGIAADEPKRIRKKARVRYPLVEWGMKEADCLAYCREHGFFTGDFYDKHKRMGCYICPLQSVGDARWLRDERPELWAKIKTLEKEIGEPWLKCGTERFDREVQQ